MRLVLRSVTYIHPEGLEIRHYCDPEALRREHMERVRDIREALA